MVQVVFTDLCSDLICFFENNKLNEGLTYERLENMVDKSVRKFERGEIIKKDPKVVESLEKLMEDLSPHSRRITTCTDELKYYAVAFLM